jgi:hypothetical protein
LIVASKAAEDSRTTRRSRAALDQTVSAKSWSAASSAALSRRDQFFSNRSLAYKN